MGFTNFSVHRSYVDDVADFCFCQAGTHTEKFPILNPTTSVVDEKDETTTSVVAENRMKTGMTFADIVCGDQSPKSVARVNPVIPSQKNHVTHAKQVARFTLEWWMPYLDSYETYHTAFMTWLLNNGEDADTTLVGNCNSGVTLSSLKGYYGKFHIWVNKN